MKNRFKGTCLALLLSAGLQFGAPSGAHAGIQGGALRAFYEGSQELGGTDDERAQVFKGMWNSATDHTERAHALRRFSLRYGKLQLNEYVKAVVLVGAESPYYIDVLKQLLEETRMGRLYSVTNSITYACSFVASCLSPSVEKEGSPRAIIREMWENLASSPQSGGWTVLRALEKLPETYPSRVPALRRIVDDGMEFADYRLEAALFLPAEEQGPALEGIAGDPWTYLNNSARALQRLPLKKRRAIVQSIWKKHQAQGAHLHVSPYILSDIAETLPATEPLRKMITEKLGEQL